MVAAYCRSLLRTKTRSTRPARKYKGRRKAASGNRLRFGGGGVRPVRTRPKGWIPQDHRAKIACERAERSGFRPHWCGIVGNRGNDSLGRHGVCRVSTSSGRGSLSYSTSPPGSAFLSVRAAAVDWSKGRGESRVAAARSLVAEAVRAYCSLQPHPDTLSGGSYHQPDDVELEPLDGFATGLACKLGRAAADLDAVSAAFWLSTAYTSMLPTPFRARFGIFYTPPALTARLLDMAARAGADWRTWHVLDPACGGGAFLGPVAVRMAESLRDCEPSEIVSSIAGRLKGLEIDPFAAWLSQFFLESSLNRICAAAGTRLPRLVEVCDSLERVPDSGIVDLVVGNPPYGRIGLSPELRTRFRRSLYGHANLYGIFTDLALRWTKPNGLVAYVTPTSFLAGQYFKALRALMAADAPPVTFDVVESRQGVFEGVLQETMLSVYQRGGPPGKTEVNRISVSANGTAEVLPVGTFQLPSNPSFPWLLPRHPDQAQLIDRLLRLPARLSDWGTGYQPGRWSGTATSLNCVALLGLDVPH